MRKAQCCRCGCTDDNCAQCIARTGVPCHWVSDDLCSACNFKIEVGGQYLCRDGKTRTVIEIDGGNVRSFVVGQRRYSKRLLSFQVDALQRVDVSKAKVAS